MAPIVRHRPGPAPGVPINGVRFVGTLGPCCAPGPCQQPHSSRCSPAARARSHRPPRPAPQRSLVPADVGLLGQDDDLPRAAPAAEPVHAPDPGPTFPPGARVVGAGTGTTCTSDALAAAVRYGGHVVFDCGPDPVTIEITRTLYTCNTTTCDHLWKGGSPVEALVVDGGGLVTLSGGGRRGIYYANSCEESLGWLGEVCQEEARPHVTFTDITFVDGNAQGPPDGFDGVCPGPGGTILMRGGRLTW